MADARHFAQWDPGVRTSTLVRGEQPGPGAVFEVVVNAGRRGITLVYETVEWDPPSGLVLRAETRWMCSNDTVRIARTDSGSAVTYDAELELRGALRLFDPLLKRTFRKIGDRAAAGLRGVLEDPSRAPS